MPIHLAIVDGQTLTRFGLGVLVAQSSDIEIVAESQSAADASAMIAATRPDVVTIDVALPDGDGLRLAQQLRDRYSDLGIVMLVSRQEDDVLFRALETGVSAFVSKTAPLNEVLCAIRHAAVAPLSFTASGLKLAVNRRRSMQDRLTLSPRETQVLGLLHDGLSTPAIASEMFISLSTAKTYVSRLYDKLGATSRAQALMSALHHGLIQYHDDGSSHEQGICDGRRGGTDRRGDVVRSLALVGPGQGNVGHANGQAVNGARGLGRLSSSSQRT
jgi:DNA-binding NarL/FixJ family response regulator